jgi:hypothetical protein
VRALTRHIRQKTLLYGRGQRLAWVSGFNSTETDKLSSCEGQDRRDEDGAETLEAIVERTRVVPEFSTNIFLAGDATAVNDYPRMLPEIRKCWSW